MGTRESRSSKLAAQPKKAPKLDKVFTCPFSFCNHPEIVRIDLKLGYAEASCLICDESYCTVPDYVTAPTDVYHEWIDERANDDVVRRRARAAGDGFRQTVTSYAYIA